MPTYTYSAINSNGMRVAGEIEASDPDAVVSLLTARGLRIEHVAIVTPAHHSPLDTDRLAQLKVSEARDLGGHIAEIISSGLPMEGGLAAVAEEMPAGRLRRALRGIVRELETGADLESVLARRRAPPYLAALVRAGRRTGRTAEILEGFIANSRVVSELRQTVWAALAYPLVLLALIVPLALFLLLGIIPAAAAVFDGFEIKLPLITTVLIAVSRFTKESGWQVLACLAGVVLVTFLVLRLALGAAGTHRMMCGIPAIGPFLRWLGLARYSQFLSLLVEGRVPLDEALILAGDAAGDAGIRADCRQIAANVRGGMTLEAAARETGRLPASFVRALSWEGYQDAFPEVLQSTADMYMGRARVLVALLLGIIPPIIVTFVALLVGFVIVAMFMPLIELLNKLS
jgi:type II secretory pathway component PulF